MDRPEYRTLIYAGRESPEIEFKRSFPWQPKAKPHRETVARLVRTMLAMGNARDGGHIIIGVEDGHPPPAEFLAVGMSPEDRTDFTGDLVADVVRQYAEPYVRFSLEHVTIDDLDFVIFAVSGFDQHPVICRKSFGDVLHEGALYVRPRSGRPRSEQVSSYAEMRALMDIAVERGVRRFLEAQARVGLGTPSDFQRFDDQLGPFV